MPKIKKIKKWPTRDLPECLNEVHKLGRDVSPIGLQRVPHHIEGWRWLYFGVPVKDLTTGKLNAARYSLIGYLMTGPQ